MHELELATNRTDLAPRRLIEVYQKDRCMYSGLELACHAVKSKFDFKDLKKRFCIVTKIYNAVDPSTEVIVRYPQRYIKIDYKYIVGNIEIDLTLFDWIAKSEGSLRSFFGFHVPTIFYKDTGVGEIYLQIGGQIKGPFVDISVESDRERMETAILKANKYYRKEHVICIGVHKFAFQRRNHFAFSVKKRRRYWRREYFITNWSRQAGDPIFIFIQFTFIGAFRNFCHAAYEMDVIVGNMRIKRIRDQKARVKVLEEMW